MLNRIAGFLNRSDRIVLLGHVSPDGDTLGACLALKLALQKAGKQAVVANVHDVPEMYRFLPDAAQVVKPDALPFEPEALLLVDVAAPDRAADGGLLLSRGLPIAQIDHHGTNPKPYPLSLVESAASATGLLALRLIEALGIALDPQIALCLYAAISTDTGNFSFPNTTPEAFAAAAKLLSQGFDLADANFRLFRLRTLPRAKLLGEALSALELYDGGRLACSRLPKAAYERCAAKLPDTEGIVQTLAEIEGVEVAVVAEYRAETETKFSLRSTGATDVAAVARSFQGGGHKNAAGMTVWASVDDAAARVLPAVLSALGATAL